MPETELRQEIAQLELDLKTKRLMEEKLRDFEELMPGYVVMVLPPEIIEPIEAAAEKRGMTAPYYISAALGHVAGIGERGIWIGDLIRAAISHAILGHLAERSPTALQRKGRTDDA